jgi:hypothetical protein
MIAYASRTGTRRNLAALRLAGWRLMISARGVHRNEGMPHALDNGAWTSYLSKEPFDEAAFLRAYELFAPTADFIVLPDIVAGGMQSLDFSMKWRARLGKPFGLQLIAVQDGMEPDAIEPIIDSGLGIFIGGTTEWKEQSMFAWGKFARGKGIYLHVGRVNSVRRIHLCGAAGAQSFDGSSVSRYCKTLPKLDYARRQRELPWSL